VPNPWQSPLDGDIETICKLTDLAPLLDHAGVDFFPHAITILMLTHELAVDLERGMNNLSAMLRAS
jgi:hypothetical protein